jgi:hypothetical protein
MIRRAVPLAVARTEEAVRRITGRGRGGWHGEEIAVLWSGLAVVLRDSQPSDHRKEDPAALLEVDRGFARCGAARSRTCGPVRRATAQGQDAPGEICGVIAEPGLTITDNSRLTCDVECATVNNPCIRFGRSGIKLSLNTFTMTGRANPPVLQDCVTTGNFIFADGIHATGVSDIVIEGPGVVQRFRRHGIGLPNVTRGVVKKLVSHQNCFSGVWLTAGTTETLVEEVVSVRNSAASSFFTCGGVCITNSHNNRIRRSEFAGNGSAALGTDTFAPCPVAVPNDFGVGLVGNSSGNIIEENGIGGNINGVFVCPGSTGNLIRENVIAGNPPSRSRPARA